MYQKSRKSLISFMLAIVFLGICGGFCGCKKDKEPLSNLPLLVTCEEQTAIEVSALEKGSYADPPVITYNVTDSSMLRETNSIRIGTRFAISNENYIFVDGKSWKSIPVLSPGTYHFVKTYVAKKDSNYKGKATYEFYVNIIYTFSMPTMKYSFDKRPSNLLWIVNDTLMYQTNGKSVILPYVSLYDEEVKITLDSRERDVYAVCERRTEDGFVECLPHEISKAGEYRLTYWFKKKDFIEKYQNDYNVLLKTVTVMLVDEGVSA